MARRTRRPLRFANVCSLLALRIAVGTGGAYAANTIGSDDIIDESIQSVDIKNGEVKTADLAVNAVTANRIVNGDVGIADLGANAVDSSKILDASIGNIDIATGAVDSNSVLDESLT